jgi:hypothetical protein
MVNAFPTLPTIPTTICAKTGIRFIIGVPMNTGRFLVVTPRRRLPTHDILAHRDRFEMIWPYTVSDPAQMIEA